jgi:energy-converting hydrogenase Eha subunit E
MPTVIYDAPTAACQPTAIKKDSRNAAEKAADDKLTAFKQKFGTEAPITQKIPFRIVGLLPDSNSTDSALSLQAFFSSFLTTYYGSGWIMSHQAAAANPILGAMLNDDVAPLMRGASYYVDLPNRNEQKGFIDDMGCLKLSDGKCKKIGPIYTMPYGNPLAALYEAKPYTDAMIAWALGIIASVSAIIMIGTIGKVIADSRKETSVFRALGAKRRDVAQIYLGYTATLGVLVFVAALAIGVLISWWIDTTTSPQLSSTAVLAFNANDLHKQFHLIGWSASDIAVIGALVLLTSLVSAVIPLLTNIRRNPVKDMREE